MKTNKKDIIMQNKIFGWLALAVGAILAVPLLAMQFTREVNWSFSDFLIIGILLFGMGFLFVNIARVTPKKYRLFIGIAAILVTLWIWAELAVGIFTNLGS